jgi:hypothetical protein
MAIELFKAEDTAMSRTGGTLVKTSAVGGGLWLAAGFIPFVSFPVLLILLAVVGILMY